MQLDVFTKGVGSNGVGQAVVDLLNSPNMIDWEQVMVVYALDSGGGGCVARGTPILTPSGYVPVQELRSGDDVKEYDFATGQLVNGTFVSGNVTNTSEVVDVNHGWLTLTPTEQPIYIQNASYVGWLIDPQNLTTADSIFDPVTHTFVSVTSVQVLQDRTSVYDVVTNDFNNFVANGALLDLKA